MALIKCKECGSEVSTTAKTCPKCGWKVKQAVGALKATVVIAATLVFANIIWGEQNSTTTNSQPPAAAVPNELKWTYEDSREKMTDAPIKWANVQSINQVELDFPYKGKQRATLTLRAAPKSKSVIFQIERGQLMCGGGCSILFRFDQGKAQTFYAHGPDDHSTKTIFLEDYNKFMANIRNAKKLYVEKTIFNNGSRIFEFDVSGLKW